MKFMEQLNKKHLIYIVVFILVLCGLVLLYKYMKSPEKTQENFSEEQNKQTYSDEIVLYYASWCGYSRMFIPEWEKFAEWASANAKQLNVKSIKCEAGNESVCMEKGIRGYPTVILYPKEGTEKMFTGDRTAEALRNFVEKELQNQ